MMSLWKDIAAALLMGMVLPGVMLHYAVMDLRQENTSLDLEITIPQETVQISDFLPVLVCRNGEAATMA